MKQYVEMSDTMRALKYPEMRQKVDTHEKVLVFTAMLSTGNYAESVHERI